LAVALAMTVRASQIWSLAWSIARAQSSQSQLADNRRRHSLRDIGWALSGRVRVTPRSQWPRNSATLAENDRRL